jgi:hypothetical protein
MHAERLLVLMRVRGSAERVVELVRKLEGLEAKL